MKRLKSLEGAYGSNLGHIYTCFFKTWVLMEVGHKNVQLFPSLASTQPHTLSSQLHLSVPMSAIFFEFRGFLFSLSMTLIKQ